MEKGRVALAISNFLRQHDLVQVQWVFLSFREEAPQRDMQELIIQERDAMQGVTSVYRKLEFSRLLVIVGGGSVDRMLLGRLHDEGACVVAADGGAEACQKVKIVPEAIIGDMDSLENREEWEEKTRVIEIGEQDSTDFEKCLYMTSAPVSVGLGMTGKRLDHTLAALSVLAKYGEQRKLALAGRTDLVLAVRGRCCFEVEPGARISIHPVQAIRFARSVGLEYGLEGVDLVPGKRTGTSNRAKSDHVEIIPEPNDNSPYLVLLDKKYLDFWLQGEFI